MNIQPFIKQITLHDFLSYGHGANAIELRPLNVLIGPNAAGKSNLIEAIGVLRAAAKDLTTPFRSTGIADWIWKEPGKTTIDTSLAIDAVLAQSGNGKGLVYHVELSEVAGRTQLLNESLQNESSSDGDIDFFYRYNDGHPILNVVSDNGVSPAHQESGIPSRRELKLKREEISLDQSILSQKNDPAFYPEIHYLAKQLGSIAIYRLWDTGPSSPIRTPSKTDDPKSHLLDDASNLALVLNNFLMRGEVRSKILNRLKSFYDRTEDIVFDIYANQVQLAIRETGDIVIPASRLSDGTLRFLALLAMLYDPAPPAVICIEEPELGMHPDIIPVIAEMLIEASERTQLIVTTHSDLLVSKLKEIPEAILVCDWSDSGTTVRRLTDADVADWDDDVSLGDIWLKGGFGGTRW